MVFYYVIFPSRGEFTSDFTDTLMWAKASVDSHTLFNKDFNYAAVLPFGGQLLMIPFVLIFGVSMKTQILGMLSFIVLFIFALVFFCRAMKWSIIWVAFMIINLLLILSISAKLREIFWGHIIYYSLGIFFLLVGLGLVFHTINVIEEGLQKSKINKKKLLILFLLSAIWFFVCSTNGLQSIILFVLPAIGGIILERYFDLKMALFHKRNLIYFLYIFILLIASLFGLKLGVKLIGTNVGGYAEAYSTFTASTIWVSNLEKLLPQWLTLIGVNVNNGDPFKSLDWYYEFNPHSICVNNYCDTNYND